MQFGFYFDQTRCIGCNACRVACKDWHDIPAGPENWMRVLYSEQGRTPDVFLAYTIACCFHCAQPVCAAACPVGAIAKREQDGIVVVDRAACLGNQACGQKCLKACPYGAPQFGPEPQAKMGKCDLCQDRLREGKPPSCVETCPTRALEAGDLAQLRARHGEGVEAVGFRYAARLAPSVVFKPKRPSPSTLGD